MTDTKLVLLSMLQECSKNSNISPKGKYSFLTPSGIVSGAIDENMKKTYLEILDPLAKENNLSLDHLEYIVLQDAILYPNGFNGEKIVINSITLFADQIVGVIPSSLS